MDSGKLLAYFVILVGSVSWLISFAVSVFGDKEIPASVQGIMMLIVGWAVASVARERG